MWAVRKPMKEAKRILDGPHPRHWPARALLDRRNSQ
jgi:hypothetical protein